MWLTRACKSSGSDTYVEPFQVFGQQQVQDEPKANRPRVFCAGDIGEAETFALLSTIPPCLNQGILRLDIPVEEAMFVHIRDSLHHLEHDISNLRLRKSSTSLQQGRKEREARDHRYYLSNSLRTSATGCTSSIAATNLGRVPSNVNVLQMGMLVAIVLFVDDCLKEQCYVLPYCTQR